MKRTPPQQPFRQPGNSGANRAAILLAALLVTLTPAWFAHAAALQVSPIRLDVSGQRPTAALTLRNDGQTPLNAQVRVFAWTQVPDEDRLERTDRIVASPPFVQIPPGAEQTVRILRVGNAPVTAEEAYRLLIDEIPDGLAAQTTGVRLQLRYSVPVFVGAPAGGRPPVLAFAFEHTSPSATAPSASAPLLLRAANLSEGHAQLSDVHLDWPNGQSTRLSPGLLGYALQHSTRRWPVAGAPAGASSATLHAVVNGEALTLRIGIEPKSAAPVAAASASTVPAH